MHHRSRLQQSKYRTNPQHFPRKIRTTKKIFRNVGNRSQLQKFLGPANFSILQSNILIIYRPN